MPGRLNTTTEPRSQGRFHRDSGYGYQDTGNVGGTALSGSGDTGTYVRHHSTPTAEDAVTGRDSLWALWGSPARGYGPPRAAEASQTPGGAPTPRAPWTSSVDPPGQGWPKALHFD